LEVFFFGTAMGLSRVYERPRRLPAADPLRLSDSDFFAR
jgi:hypothetical protein